LEAVSTATRLFDSDDKKGNRKIIQFKFISRNMANKVHRTLRYSKTQKDSENTCNRHSVKFKVLNYTAQNDIP